MRALVSRVVRNPMATVMGLVLASLGGLYALAHMPVDLFPPMDIPLVNVVSHYPGAAPGDMELLVTRPIEDEIRSAPGVKRVASTSVQGVSLISVEFNWGTSVREARQVVQTRLARLGGVLPPAVQPRIESIGTTLEEVAGYVIYGASDPVRLRTVAERDLAGRIRAVEGVSSVEVLGGERPAYDVTLDPAALRRLGLSVTDVAGLIRRYNGGSVAGFMVRSGREYLIRGDGRLRSEEDIRALPLERTRPGGPVLLGEVAEVRRATAPRHYVVHGDGVPAVALLVRKQPGASTTRVVRGVDEALGGLAGLLPQGARVRKFYDQSEVISGSRREIVRNLLAGAVLAVFVLYLFLGSLVPTLIVAVTIPLTLLATIALMRLLGLGFNVITMTALTLAIGMIVDDAIVVAENIFRSAGERACPLEASIEGASDIAGPDAAGTFTTVAAFLPLVMVTGLAAIFLRPFAITIASALVLSLVLSLTLVPLLFGRLRGPIGGRGGHVGERVLCLLRRWLERALGFSLRHRLWVLLASTAALGLSALTLVGAPATFLPPMDEGAVLVEYIMPPGTSLVESDRVGALLERAAMRDPDVSTVYRRTGSPEVGREVEGVNMGELLVKLGPMGSRKRTASEVTASLKRAFSRLPGMVLLYHQPTQEKLDESFSGLPALFGVTIFGPRLPVLRALAAEVEGVLRRDPAIVDVVNNSGVRSPEVDVRPDYAALARHGLGPSDVFDSLRAARLGLEATRIITERGEAPVIVRLAEGRVLGPRDIGRLPVGSGSVPLGRLAGVRVRQGPAAITRINGRREITLTAEVEGGIPALVRRLGERMRSVHLPRGYSLEFTGEYRLVMRTALETAFMLGAALVVIYLIMVMQFRAFLEPLVILVTIPLAFTGASLALWLTRQGLDVSVAMGALTLAGMGVNNAIVLVDFMNRERRAGKDLRRALYSAVSVRLRPILLTSLTTIAALLPTALGTTPGSSLFRPFAITVTGGLLSAVPATLIVVPVLTSLVLEGRGGR